MLTPMMRVTTGALITLLLAACARDGQPQGAPPLEKASIHIPTAKCSTCKRTISSAVKKVEGVTNVNVDVDTKTAEVEFHPDKTSKNALQRVIADAGYTADTVRRNPDAYARLLECCKLDSADAK